MLRLRKIGLLILLEYDWRVIKKRRNKIIDLIENSVGLSSDQMLKLEKQIDKRMYRLALNKTVYEKLTDEKIIFYG